MAAPTSKALQRVAWATGHDPKTRARLSKQARAEMRRRFDEIARRHGFAASEHGWAKTKGLMCLSFGLQPSRSGFECFVNLSSRPRSILSHMFGMRHTSVLRLGWFYQHPEQGDGEPGTVQYPDVISGDDAFEQACQVLDKRALPHLDTLNGRRRADRAQFLQSLVPPV